jgi:hypothetical protein
MDTPVTDMERRPIFLAVFVCDEFRLQVEYLPGQFGIMEIVSADYQPRVKPPFKQHRAELRRDGKKRRGLVLTTEEQQLEMAMPYSRRENPRRKF